MPNKVEPFSVGWATENIVNVTDAATYTGPDDDGEIADTYYM
jgi:hypothetical protein